MRTRAHGIEPVWRFRSSVAAVALAGSGALLGWCAWQPGGGPGLAIFAPLLWAFAPSRATAALGGCCYCLAVVRFLPAMAGNWYSSPTTGYFLWAAVGGAGGLVFGVTWSGARQALRCSAGAFSLFALWLVLGVVVPGHPMFGWGYVLPGWGWIGLGVALALTTVVATVIRVSTSRMMAALLALTCVSLVGILGTKYRPEARGTVSPASSPEPIVAVSTAWGSYPEPSSPEIEARLQRIASVVDSFASKGRSAILVFPEAVLGKYDSGIGSRLTQIVDGVGSRAHIGLVVGVDLPLAGHLYGNAASIHRADRDVAWILARQSTPIAQWRPWASDSHFPSNWFASTAIEFGAKQTAAMVFCHEEYAGGLHLLLQWRERPAAIVVLSNLWAAPNETANAVQAAHTEGVARLFGQTMFRAVNLPVTSGPSQWLSEPRR